MVKLDMIRILKCCQNFKAGTVADNNGIYNNYKIDFKYKPLILKFVPLYYYNTK